MIAAPARPRLAVALAATALSLAACGGDDEESTATSGATGATGAQGAVATDITVGEFIAELQPQKQEILEELTASEASCENVDVDNGFVLLISAKAIDADPGSPLSELVAEEC